MNLVSLKSGISNDFLHGYFHDSFVLSFDFFVVQLLLHGIQLHNNKKKYKSLFMEKRYGNRFSFSDQGDVA